ncbi:acVLRF1 family peptidyl-tRNA hydrolase [Goodfellowiella coeruleoviolacea]|uniref:acVLRF1 family peptidyl-tRNA hydrolase n=1 Tax=Goodfellowiella coeruleoviolacea TaxID=334858 RepID=UPI0020A3D901|nr:acVLRF1 family peptidyl-tRNA hydrolase [Goodfellowiella coeruleoviolacea]
MTRVRSVAGGGRAVEVAPERVPGWFDRFAQRHGGVSGTVVEADRVRVTASDGAHAAVGVPFGRLTGGLGRWPGLELGALLAHLAAPRRVGLVLVRLGGHSVGVAENGRVVASTTDRRQVHGRNKAGGWSQQRFARRREGQARQALQAAADDVARVLLPHVADLDAVVLGGDRRALDEVCADRRLAALVAKAEPRVLDIAEPRRSVLDEAAARAWHVEIVVSEPPEEAADRGEAQP